MRPNPVLLAAIVTAFVALQVLRHLGHPLVTAALAAYFFAFLALVLCTRHWLKHRPQ